MKSKLAISILLIGSMFAAFFTEIPAVKAHWPMTFDQYGPHVGQILTKLFSNANEMFAAFNACSIDLVSQPATAYWTQQWQNRPDINMMDYGGEIAEYEFDINNNGTKPDTPYSLSPEDNIGRLTAFRHAMAHAVDRSYIITSILQGYGLAVYTKVPPALGGWVNPSVDQHAYDSAAAILDAADINDHDGDGYRDWPRSIYPYPYKRVEIDFFVVDSNRVLSLMGDRLIWELAMLDLHVTRFSLGSYGDSLIMRTKCHTIYTSYKKFKKDPDYLFTYYHSSMYWHPGACPNYNNVNDPELDGYLEGLYHAQNPQQALTNCHEAQRVMAEKCFVIPVCSPSGLPKAGKTHYSDPGTPYYCHLWEGFVNEMGFGLNSWWSFLNAHPAGYEWPVPFYLMQLRYGLSFPEFPSLNPLYSQWVGDWEAMGKVYDTLLRANPYDLSEDLEWLAKRWEVGIWTTPNGQEATKIILELRDDVYWHDGRQLNATDLKFIIEELDDLLLAYGFPPPWFYSSVLNVYSVNIINEFKVEVRMNVKSYFAFHWIGELPILPEHIWRPIITSGDPTTFAPDPQLIGAGPFKVYPHSIDPAANDYYVPYQYIKLDVYWEYFNNHPIRVSMVTHGSYIDAYLQNYHNTTITASASIAVDGTPRPGIFIVDVPGYPTYGNIPGIVIVRFSILDLPKALHDIAVTVGYTFGGEAISDTFSSRLLAPSVDGDITNDGTVGLLDAIHLSFHFGLKAWVWPEDDLDADNVIGLRDALILIANWGASDP